jgi:hypothetical protein
MKAQTTSNFIETDEYGLTGLSIDGDFLYVVSRADSAYRKNLSANNSDLEFFDLAFNGNGYYGYSDICKVDNFIYVTKPYNGAVGIYRLNLNDENPTLVNFISVNNAFGLAKRNSELYISASNKIYKINLSVENPSLIEIASDISPNGSGNGTIGLKIYDNFLYISQTSGISKIDLDSNNYELETITSFTGWGFAKSDDNTFFLTYNDNSSETGAIYELNISTQTYTLLITIDGFIQTNDIEYSNNSLFVTTLEGESYKVVRVDLNSLSTNEFNRNDMSIYPNPANEFLNIKGFKSNNITIINSAGQIIKSIEVENDQINISDLKSGVYFIKTENVYSKFIKN